MKAEPGVPEAGGMPTWQASGEAARVGRVVVGVDDSPGGVAAIRFAVGLARSRGEQVVAVRCWAPGLPRHGGRRHRHSQYQLLIASYPGAVARDLATEVVKRVFGEAVGGIPRDLSVLVQTPHGDPGAVLTGFAQRDDVLIVGRRPGHRTAKAVHGSVSGYCACHSAGDVIAVSPDGSASLITPRRGLFRRS